MKVSIDLEIRDNSTSFEAKLLQYHYADDSMNSDVIRLDLNNSSLEDFFAQIEKAKRFFSVDDTTENVIRIRIYSD